MNKCIECGNKTTYIKHTQFAGSHPFCTKHAKKQEDFLKKDSSGFDIWEKL